MSTVYTLNGKVLKNATNDKWLAKKEAPAGFVMNGSNATYSAKGGGFYVSWPSPTYPDAYNGGGKRFILVNNNVNAPTGNPLLYTDSPSTEGPQATSSSDMSTLGTSEGVLVDNVAVQAGYGVYLVWPNPILPGSTLEEVQAYMANVSITIVDP